MSDFIKLLPDSVANQIAAGEVVQRPASVVKELLENAIDAKGKKIQLIVKDAGRTLIQVIDDGKGMSATDARMSFERHATSKIQCTDDIFSIVTKGFRGEALASIAAVAQVELKTKTTEEDLGHFIRIEGSEVKEQNVLQTNDGTSIAVKNLFYNVPARRNFLKSTNVEMRHIIDEFHRVALAHPELSFTLYHNDNKLFDLPKGSFRQRIVTIFGKKYNDRLVPIEEETDVVSIKGFIIKPEFVKKKRGEQFFFVNHRFIKNPYLHRAVLKGFDNLLPNGYHPSYFINLIIDPKHIDINIHPTKTEIKFDDEHTIFSFLLATIKHSLGQYNIAPSLDFDLNPKLDVHYSKPTKLPRQPRIEVNPTFNPFEKEKKPNSQQIQSQNDFYQSFQTNEDNSFSTDFDQQITFEENNSVEIPFEKKDFSYSKTLQIHQKYILLQSQSGVMIIDQYRAHQRILFEYYLELLSRKSSLSQQLMFPIVKDISITEKNTLIELNTTLIQLGFDINLETENQVIINAIPGQIKAQQVGQIIDDLMSKETYEPSFDLQENMALTIARSTAIKGGETLTQELSNHLIQKLFQTSNPNYSPNGKNIFLDLTLDFIKKNLN